MQPGDMPPMIDVESPDPVAPGAYADAIRAWIDRVETVTGTTPFIYTGYYYWNDNLGPTAQFADYPLWIANYGAMCPLIPDAWQTWAIHQYCACETVAGIAGAVDGDLFNQTFLSGGFGEFEYNGTIQVGPGQSFGIAGEHATPATGTMCVVVAGFYSQD